jgi:uncharacterized repeat protein (TIGR01451 family)
MKSFLFYLKRMPKQYAAIALALFAFVALPVNSALAADVRIEGSIGVANQTTGETTYKESTSATYDQVVKYSVYYHNRELTGSDKVAKNFKIKIDFPTAAGTTQVTKVTMGGDNTNTITDTAVVNLNRADAHLEFIPGSVHWKHNVGTRENIQLKTEKIADSVILNGAVIENVKPCHEFEATVTFMARVKVPSVGINKYVHAAGGTEKAVTSLAVQPGARVEYMVSAKNLSNENLTNVYVRDPLPKGLTYVPGTAKKYFGTYNGTVMSADEANAFFGGRKNIGTLLPGARGYITFEATVDSADKLACGTNTIKNVAVVDTDQTGEYNNSATVTVNKTCAEQPNYTCDMFHVVAGDNRTVKVDQFKTTATNGATFKDVTISWGDSSTALTTNNAVGQTHQYAADGTYNIVATARFTVNGQDKTATSALCAQKVSFEGETPVAPPALPNTGAGETIGLFAGVSVAGAIAHRLWARRFVRG